MNISKSLKVFLRVVESGSFSRTARELGMGQPAVSKQVSALERELGVRLFRRSTRKLSLTEEGKKVYEKGGRIAESLEEFFSIARQASVPRGTLRIACPVVLGSFYLVPTLKHFSKLYPELKFEIKMSDNFVDLLEEGVDVAVRVGNLPSVNLIAKNVGRLRRIVVGSRDYFKKNPPPKTPADLLKHACIVSSRSVPQDTWLLKQGPVKVSPSLKVDNMMALREAVLSGFGIALGGSLLFLTGGTLDKRLVTVLDRYQPEPIPVNFLLPQREYVPQRVRLFVDYFYQEMQGQSWLTPNK